MSKSWDIICSDVLEWAENYQGPKFMACLCDPPYHLKGGFMSKAWDRDGSDAIAFQPETWKALTEHLHPGAFGMSFASARGWHRLAVAIEDAGLIFHPSIFMLGWVQGQGFPKASRVGKNGNHPEFEGHRYGLQAMKPCLEPIILFQKPYAGRPVESIVSTGAGALWIDGGRVATGDNMHRPAVPDTDGTHEGWDRPWRRDQEATEAFADRKAENCAKSQQLGRWPPNVCLSHIAPDADGNGGCQRVGTRRVKNRGTLPDGVGVQGDGENKGIFKLGSKVQSTYADPDGLETVAAWECVDGCPVKALGEQTAGTRASKPSRTGTSFRNDGMFMPGQERELVKYNDTPTGNAARFYPNHSWQYEIAERLAGVTPFRYVAKASRAQRDIGLDSPEIQQKRVGQTVWTNRCVECEASRPQTEAICGKCGGEMFKDEREAPKARNPHPTVKPISLNVWLATLLLPPPEYAPRRLLVPFAGSGSEMIGAGQAGWEEIIGVEMEEEYCQIAEARCRFWAGWSERGYDDLKEILKAAKKEEKKREKAQMELEL